MPVEYHVSFAAHWFISASITWWETLGYTYNTQGMDWETFENLFRESYFNAHHHWAIIDDFEFLYQDDMTVTEYYNRFMDLAYYCMAGNVNTLALILKFMSRLWRLIADKIV